MTQPDRSSLVLEGPNFRVMRVCMKNENFTSTVRSLSNQALLSDIRARAAEERKVTLQVLELLREVERRRLFAQEGYGSLFDYTVKALGYSEASAARRINSMRLLKEVPEIKESVEKGALNLSTLSTVQTFLKREERERGREYRPEEKLELISRMENSSQRQCEKMLMAFSPESARPREKLRVVSERETELRFVVSDEMMQKIEKLKGLLAHSHPNMNLSELFELLADRALDQIDPVRKEERKREREIRKSTPMPELRTAPTTKKSALVNVPASTPTPELRHHHSPRFISAALRSQIWFRDQGRCTFIASDGKRCTSQFALQIDHITPVSQGGHAEFGNLRLLCRQHNTWEAIRVLGREKMGDFIRELK